MRGRTVHIQLEWLSPPSENLTHLISHLTRGSACTSAGTCEEAIIMWLMQLSFDNRTEGRSAANRLMMYTAKKKSTNSPCEVN